MTDVTMSEVTAFEPATAGRGILVPRSTVEAEVRCISDYTKEPTEVRFYCQTNERRLFDFHLVEKIVDTIAYWEAAAVSEQVEKRCPRCGLLNTRDITTESGVKVGESGRWLCDNCRAFLAEVDAVRGRLTVPCRCRQQHRVSVPEALHALRLWQSDAAERARAAAEERLAELAARGPDDEDDLDDTPF